MPDGNHRAMYMKEDILFKKYPKGSVAADPGVVIDEIEVQVTSVTVGNNQTVHISPKCASVVIVTSAALGAAIAAALLPIVLAIAGFSEAGVAAESFAAAWQSTMPLVAKGSLFAVLQSAAMAGVGEGAIVSAAALGGAVGAGLISTICKGVDSVTPGSLGDKIVVLVHSAVQDADGGITDATWEQHLLGKLESLSQALISPKWEQWEHKVANALKSWLDEIFGKPVSAGRRPSLPNCWAAIATVAFLFMAIN
eukprot:CAMPEP_0181316792 /NCGR_PEP_ID=MMETSP1101-20121128/16085_1 /TAXON_ID=46948 /ORGANISM="Rhodomonas abbreviata, Strain Caron Lab Isolate" /LENGTH=252 /DNA_ID=CAMNT_0023424065 /DNA_START=111 /DNA_END=869 /DNA_ORIENTATION=+